MAEQLTATALRYDERLPAPFVVAQGREHLARRMMDLARRAGVPVASDAELAERLLLLKPGDVIPDELYRPVAEIFLFLLELSKTESKKKSNEENSN